MIALYIYLVLALIGSLITLFDEDVDALLLSPKEVYDTFHLNWFGAVTVFIIMVLIAPIPYFFYFIKLLFTVGRK